MKYIIFLISPYLNLLNLEEMDLKGTNIDEVL
jgi:hypothetical protein